MSQEQAPSPAQIPRLSQRMEAVITALDLASRARAPDEVHDPTKVTPFHGSVPPPVSLAKYAQRIAGYSGYGENGLVLGLALLSRFVANVDADVPLNVLTVHRLLLAALTAAGKAHLDFFVNNKYMSLVGGVPLQELNSLELRFLSGLQYEVIPTSREASRIVSDLIEPLRVIDPKAAEQPSVGSPAFIDICNTIFRALVRIGVEETTVRHSSRSKGQRTET